MHLKFLLVLLFVAPGFAGCAEPECPADTHLAGVAYRCLHEWLPEYYWFHLHNIEAHYDEANQTMTIDSHLTSLIDERILFDRYEVEMGGAVTTIYAHARQELPGTDSFYLEPRETKLVRVEAKDVELMGTRGLWLNVYSSFEDVRGINFSGHWLHYRNKCLVMEDSEILVGDGHWKDRCSPEETTTRLHDIYEDHLHPSLYMQYGFFPNGKTLQTIANVPGPHDQDFWYDYCPHCYDGWPPEKYGAVE